MLISIGPSVDKTVAMRECNDLRKLDPHERLVLYDRLLNYLKTNDKKLARELQEHWEHHLKGMTYSQIKALKDDIKYE